MLSPKTFFKAVLIVVVSLYFLFSFYFMANTAFNTYKARLQQDTAIAVQNQITEQLMVLQEKCEPLVIKTEKKEATFNPICEKE